MLKKSYQNHIRMNNDIQNYQTICWNKPKALLVIIYGKIKVGEDIF